MRIWCASMRISKNRRMANPSRDPWTIYWTWCKSPYKSIKNQTFHDFGPRVESKTQFYLKCLFTWPSDQLPCPKAAPRCEHVLPAQILVFRYQIRVLLNDWFNILSGRWSHPDHLTTLTTPDHLTAPNQLTTPTSRPPQSESLVILGFLHNPENFWEFLGRLKRGRVY